MKLHVHVHVSVQWHKRIYRGYIVLHVCTCTCIHILTECETSEPQGHTDCSVDAQNEAADFDINSVSGLWFVLGYTQVSDITWDAGVVYNRINHGQLEMTYTGYERCDYRSRSK